MTARAERETLQARRAIYVRNLHNLEERKAQYSFDTPVSLENEIRETEAAIADIDRVLKPARTISRDVLATMDDIDRHVYTITLWAESIQAQVETREEMRRGFRQQRADFRRLIVVTAALVLAGMARPTVTWHVWLLGGLTIAILAGVALDMYWSERKR